MSICTNDGCDLETFNELDKCILHCSKENLDSNEIRESFYDSLDTYVFANNVDGYDFCRFLKILFPEPDAHSLSYNYINILNSILNIHFDNCEFFTTGISLDKRNVYFQDCCFHYDWTLYDYGLLINEDDVIYQNCTFQNKVETHTPENTWTYTYNYSQFDYECVFVSDIHFYRARFECSPFNGKQDNYKINIFNKLLIEDCEFIVFELHLLNQNNGEIEFKKCSFEKKLKIRNIEFFDYETEQNNKSRLKTLKIIDCHVADNAYLRIGYLDVDEFILSNLRNPPNSELNIGDCHFDSFKLRNFRNTGRFKLYKINVTGKEKGNLFQIDNTSIGDADFQSINLNSFSTVKLFDNIFANINYTNMQWKEVVEVGEHNGIGITEIAKKRDTYRVLKNVAIRNSDQPQSLIFYAKEMQYHKKLTIEDRCKDEGTRQPFRKNIFCKNVNSRLREGRMSDIITLCFSEKTNNFGLSWLRPFVVWMFLSAIFYESLLMSLNVDNTIECWKYFFQFINPTHSTEFIAKGQWTIYSFFIDFTYRIIGGLFIYQTVIAFRKFTKKQF